MLDARAVEELAHDAVRAAREYFGLSGEWQILMQEAALDGCSAKITPQVDYMRAGIVYDLRSMETLEQVWVRIAHEVAHLVCIEQRLFFSALESHLQGDVPDALIRLWIHADERTVSRLERMFARDCPMPKLEAANG